MFTFVEGVVYSSSFFVGVLTMYSARYLYKKYCDKQLQSKHSKHSKQSQQHQYREPEKHQHFC